MAKALRSLADLVFMLCHSAQDTRWPTAEFETLQERARQEVALLHDDLWCRIYKSPANTDRFVESYFLQVTEWMDRLYRKAGSAIAAGIRPVKNSLPGISPLPKRPAPNSQSLALILHHHLFQSLTDLRRRFHQLAHTDIAVPHCMLPPMTDALQKDFEAIAPLLQSTDADAGFNLALTASLQQMIHNDPDEFSYRRYYYLRTVIRHLTEALRQRNKKLKTEELICLLSSVNFNTPVVSSACRNWLQGIPGDDEEADTETTPLPAPRLRQMMKRLKQVKEVAGFTADRTAPNLRTELIAWIREELAWRTLPHADREQQRIETTLKVGQLAFLVRLFVDAGALPKSNQVSLLRLFCQYFQTRDTGEISTDSMRTRYYNVEQATVMSVRNLLLSLAKQSHKFPR